MTIAKSNLILQSIMIAFITLASVHFDRPSILLFYSFVPIAAILNGAVIYALNKKKEE